MPTRQSWGSRLGIILAVAGSAIGLGNYLRFPSQAAQNGGGAFLIPYFIAFLLLGLPLMWIEWTVGRYGGGFGRSTAPGIFHSLWNKNRFIKYFGVIGIFGPLVIFIYYVYIESWLLAYSFFALSGKLAALASQDELKHFLSAFQGLEKNAHFDSIGTAYFFFLITFLLNVSVVYYGIKGGIERLCKITMPLLAIFSFALLFRVLTLGAPNPAQPDWNIVNGLGWLWNPDFSALFDAKTWLAAAGQVFFTLSVGIGVILTYASYLKKEDDVVLSGLSSASMNEFAEVIFGGTLVIPVAFAFFGPGEIGAIASSGTFNLSFVTMPLIFTQMGVVFSFIWFFLLFIAGVTSSVSLVQPAIAFMEDEFEISRAKASTAFGLVTFVLCQPAIFWLGKGAVDELDFWGGNFCLVLFGTVEIILFTWVFGIEKAWKEIHHGADLEIPRLYKWIIKYVSPACLIAILVSFVVQDLMKPDSMILMKSVTPENYPYVLGTRLMMLGIFLAIALGVKLTWRQRWLAAPAGEEKTS
jgi:SNF family Na+-dependent transporter